MSAIRGEFVFFNGSEQNKSVLARSKGEDTVVYEVLRVVDRIPLFFEDHLFRLSNSCKMVGKSMPVSGLLLREQIVALALKNGYAEGNVMINFVFGKDKVDLIVHFVHHLYPSLNDYQYGVSVGLLYQERPNPEAKVVNQSLRDAANKMIKEQNVYEVLLVGRDDNITEGSRSNVCFVKGDTLITAPADKVLKGITLLKTLDLCQQNGIPVIHKNYSPAEISGFDAAFLSGTSPKLLPISLVGNIRFDVQNALMRLLMKEYGNIVSDYLNQNK